MESLLTRQSAGKTFIEVPALEMAAKAMAEEPDRALVGRQIGAYKITSLLGAGGMGEVYRAEDTRLGRAVAVKVLPEEMARDKERLSRFVREARAASALNHANVAHIYEIGQSDGLHFIAMEYVEGQSLAQRMSGQPLELTEVLDIGIQAVDALEEAHRKGITHRDIKSANLMITAKGQVKVLDFGLAKITRPEGEAAGSDVSTSVHTAQGLVMGTLRYMSPEQVLGKELDARTDLFSLGVVLYEMTTGRLPFSGSQGSEVMDRILHAQPEALARFNYEVPAELERITRKCLEKDRERRYQLAREVQADLSRLKEGSAASSVERVDKSVAKPGARLRQPVAVAAVMLMIVAAIAYVLFFRRAPDTTPPLRAVPLTTLPGVARYPSFSADGNYVAFAWTVPKQENFDIYVQQIGAGSPLRLTPDPSSDYNPVWSPDGRWIAFLRGGSSLRASGHSELRLIPPLGGPERKVADVRIPDILGISSFLSWCPDSSCLVVTDAQGEGRPAALFVVSLETGEKRQLTTPEPTAVGDSAPAIAPDGRTLVFRRNISAGLTGQLYSLPLGEGPVAGSALTLLTPPAHNANDPAWMPDGREILFSAAGGLWRLAVPGPGQPMRLPFVGEDGLMPVVSRPNAGRLPRMAYVRSFRDENIWRLDTSAPGLPASSPPAVAIASTRLDLNPQLSPDGRRVAFQSNRSGNMEVWLADLDGANAVQLTSLGAPTTGSARWSPDGKLIAFNSNLEGQWEIYVVGAMGGRPRRLTSHPANDGVPSFSRDGRWVYFSSNRTGQFEIWKIPAFGGDPVQVSHNVGYVPFESPDGAYVFYTQTVSTASALWRLPISGGEPVKVLEGILFRNFVVLDRGVYYIDQFSRQTRLQFFDFASRRSTTVVRGLGDVRYGLTATADGRTILYSKIDATIDDMMLVENFR